MTLKTAKKITSDKLSPPRTGRGHCFHTKATPHKDRLTALSPAYLYALCALRKTLFRHFCPKSPHRRQPYSSILCKNDEKFTDVIRRQSLCGIALIRDRSIDKICGKVAPSARTHYALRTKRCDAGVLYVRQHDVGAVAPKGGTDAANRGQQVPRSFDAATGARLLQRCLYVDRESVSVQNRAFVYCACQYGGKISQKVHRVFQAQ